MATAKLVFVSELTSLQEKPPNPRVDSPLRKYFKIPSIRMIPVKSYKIGAVAKEIGLSVKAIRFYEKIGLIPSPERTLSSGYRLYTEGDIRRLRLIQRAKLLGLRLWQIKEIVQSLKGQGFDCNRLKPRLQKLVNQQLIEIDKKLRELSLLKEELRKIQKGSGKTPLPRGFCICGETASQPIPSRRGLNILGQ